MKKLLKYLSPFAPDQSGACGVLYELGGLIVICDAGGCAGNICGFDEPRWFTKRSAVFSAGLRDMDAIMGRDDKLIEKLAKAQESVQGNFSAIVGTPVPAVIATDMKALKRMAEKKLGVPCISIYCDGTKYYDVGEEEAWYQLFDEFLPEMFSRIPAPENKETENEETEIEVEKAIDLSDREPLKKFIGIIGATPLETGYADLDILNALCEKEGIENPIIFGMGDGLDDVDKAFFCKKNLVVSPAGIRAARLLEEKYNIPYEVGFPFIPDTVLDEVEKIEDKKNVLIIHTQFAANALRDKLREKTERVDCATFFMQLDEYKEERDFHLKDEDELWEIAESGKYDLVIADGEIETLFRAAGYKGEFINYSHFAISGNMNDNSVLIYS